MHFTIKPERISLKISEDVYEYATYLLQMFGWIGNCGLEYIRLL